MVKECVGGEKVAGKKNWNGPSTLVRLKIILITRGQDVQWNDSMCDFRKNIFLHYRSKTTYIYKVLEGRRPQRFKLR